MDELKEYEGFTVKLALVDSLPVIFFSLALILVATALSGTGLTFWVVLIGAIMIVISGLCKVLWKLLLGLKIGDVKILNKIFVPFMAGGFVITLVGVIIGTVTKAIKWSAILPAIASFPALVFFILGFCGLCGMGYVKSSNKRDDFNKDARKNWIAQFVNAFSQLMIFLGTLFALKG
ncbi:MAG: hypothetical protein IK036_04645 [Clostridia bacterium]|nr:hypothetical protein [Clostridia bacterium]MBR5976816.1 hypothetical protein [Clostridia bacterium]MBR5992026.1 hypothetical protein [Clostridia bacterium]MBR6479606.1 hypothetical protein [Clostridia bacterium]MBR6511878.1 hypothetical protein [Clostridia bacterium]